MRSKRHLCDSCEHNYPECEATGEDIVFGDGLGNDNIMECQKYHNPVAERSTLIKDRVIAYLQKLIDERRLRVTFDILDRADLDGDKFRVYVNYGMCDLHLYREFDYMSIYLGKYTVQYVCDSVITDIICTWNAHLFKEG